MQPSTVEIRDWANQLNNKGQAWFEPILDQIEAALSQMQEQQLKHVRFFLLVFKDAHMGPDRL